MVTDERSEIVVTEHVQTFLFLVCTLVGVVAVGFLIFNETKRKSAVGRFSLEAENSGSVSFFELIDKKLPAVAGGSETIAKKFYIAGFYDFKYANLYMPLKYLVLLAGGAGIYWLSTWKGLESLTVIAFVCGWLVFSIIVPDAILDSRAKALQAKVSGQLPYLLDLMAVCVQTGMTIESSLGYLAKEMAGFDKHLAHLLNKTNDRARVVGLTTALDELYEQIPSNEMRSFVMTLKQSLQYGTSIYQVLTTLAADIREVKMLEIEEKIGKLAAKMSVPLILFIMVPIVILIAAPGIMRMMSGV